jgi:putative transposase
MTFVAKSKLPRLSREFYRGRAVVFWTHTFEHRATGWLNDAFHSAFREMCTHACARYEIACPIYVLMPDHWHLVWMGLTSGSDQRLATAFLREHLASYVGSAKLQDRAHDHVLRDDERKRGAFVSACHYVQMNPVRAGLSDDWKKWPFTGALVAGYPALDARAADFWEKFWRIHARLVDGHGFCSPPRERRD